MFQHLPKSSLILSRFPTPAPPSSSRCSGQNLSNAITSFSTKREWLEQGGHGCDCVVAKSWNYFALLILIASFSKATFRCRITKNASWFQLSKKEDGDATDWCDCYSCNLQRLLGHDGFPSGLSSFSCFNHITRIQVDKCTKSNRTLQYGTCHKAQTFQYLNN